MTPLSNALFYGDCLENLRQYIGDETVDGCYLDPPFNSDANYNRPFQSKEKGKQKKPPAPMPEYESSEFLQKFDKLMSSDAEKAAMLKQASEIAQAATERQKRRTRMQGERQTHDHAGSVPLPNWEESGEVRWEHRGDEMYVRLPGYVIVIEDNLVALALAKYDAGEVIFAYCKFTDIADIERMSVRDRVFVTGRAIAITPHKVTLDRCKLNYIDVIGSQRMK